MQDKNIQTETYKVKIHKILVIIIFDYKCYKMSQNNSASNQEPQKQIDS